MEDRDESLLKLYFRMVGQSIAQQSRFQAKGRSPDLELLSALFAKDRALRMKRILAEQFAELESLLDGLGGPEGTTIISGRNEIALHVLRKEIQRGRKKIGIFYGAGHMKDMDTRLRQQFKLQPTDESWIQAWDLR